MAEKKNLNERGGIFSAGGQSDKGARWQFAIKTVKSGRSIRNGKGAIKKGDEWKKDNLRRKMPPGDETGVPCKTTVSNKSRSRRKW